MALGMVLFLSEFVHITDVVLSTSTFFAGGPDRSSLRDLCIFLTPLEFFF